MKNLTTTFSVIMPHYEHSVSAEYLKRALDSLKNQTYQSFDILLFHDGPKDQPFSREIDLTQYPQLSHVELTERRYGDWGHSLRDLGIRKAKGDYILHLNADNYLYPFAFERILQEMSKERGRTFPDIEKANLEFLNNNNIVIFPVLMVGMQSNGQTIWYEKRNDKTYETILTGYPAYPGFIDCMQLVMRRELWLSYGGWYDKSENSDGDMYMRFVQEHGAKYVPTVLGEHW